MGPIVTPRHRIRLALVVVALLAATACGGGGGDDDAAREEAATTTSTTGSTVTVGGDEADPTTTASTTSTTTGGPRTTSTTSTTAPTSTTDTTTASPTTVAATTTAAPTTTRPTTTTTRATTTTTAPPPTTTAPPPPPPTTTTAPPSGPRHGTRNTGCEQYMFDQINVARANVGAPPVQFDTGIQHIAINWSDEMARTQTLKHNPDYPDQIAEVRNYRYAAENVGRGHQNESLFQAFMDSPGHRKNIENPNYGYVTVGCLNDASGQLWVTQNFWGA